jgi:hypothetical protein
MQALHEVIGQELRWIQPNRRKLQFELRANDSVVATLEWVRGSGFIGQCVGGRYRFMRKGWFPPRILVWDAPTGAADATNAPEATAIATFTRSGGILSGDGQTFLWKKPAMWTSEWIWVDGSEVEAIRFHQHKGYLTGAVARHSPAATLPELALLLLLGQCLITFGALDAAA